MSNNRKSTYSGNARFIEIGTAGQPFRSLINADHLTNCRFEPEIRTDNMPAQYDADGEMTAPPQEGEPYLAGWKISLVFGEQVQGIGFDEEEQAVAIYNTILDMLVGVGCPITRMPKLTVSPPEPVEFFGPDGNPLADIPPLTDEELDQLENPVFDSVDIDAIADAIEDGLGTEGDPDDPTAK